MYVKKLQTTSIVQNPSPPTSGVAIFMDLNKDELVAKRKVIIIL